VLLWDAPLTDVPAFAGALDRLRSAGVQRLVVVARSFGKEILGLLSLNTLPDFTVVPVEIPHEGAEQIAALDDIAALTGARVLRPEANDRLGEVQPDACGTATRIVVGRRMLNILANTESPACQVRQGAVRDALLDTTDENDERRLLTRLGRLTGGMAVVWVGAPTTSQRADRMANLHRTLGGIRHIQRSGMLSGLGATCARLACTSSGQEIGEQVARSALRAPIRWLARNAGFDPETAIAGLHSTEGRACAWDTTIPATVLLDAVRIGLTNASLAISSDVLIHKPRSLAQADLRP
jgi:chaperonin GroEL